MPRDTFVHLLIEAMRRAYKDRAEYLGDPRFCRRSGRHAD